MGNLFGSAPDQVSPNGNLGLLAFRDYLGLKANPGVVPTIASASVIQPTTPVAFVSGTTAIDTIIPPPEFVVGGGEIVLIPTAIWSTTTAGNIALAQTVVAFRAMLMIYDALTAKWYPSY